MKIALCGMPGCGKSSVAQELSSRCGCFWFDLDRTICLEEGRSIPEIFASEGESLFRALEADALQRIVEDYEDFPVTMVLALGGGTLQTPLCKNLVKENFNCIYLRATAEQLTEDLIQTGIADRPLLKDCLKEDGAAIDRNALLCKVRALLEERKEVYEGCADIIIDTAAKSYEELAAEITQKTSLQ